MCLEKVSAVHGETLPAFGWFEKISSFTSKEYQLIIIRSQQGIMADLRCSTQLQASPLLGREVILAHHNDCGQHRALLWVWRLQVAHQEECVSMHHACMLSAVCKAH